MRTPIGLWRRSYGAVAVAILVSATLLGCTPQDVLEEAPGPSATTDEDAPATGGANGPAVGGTLRVGLLVDPVSIDPRFIVDDEGELIVDALFDPLVRFDDDGEVVPAAAERWDIDDEGRRFTLHLREATFHNGAPVTASDFKRTFDHIADSTAQPPSFLAYLLEDVAGIDTAQTEGGGIEGVVAEDARTLTIELARPHPGFLGTLADPSLVPTPRQAAEDPEGFAQEPIGNGPFAMAGPREPGAFIRLVRAEAYHTPAWLDEVLFTLYASTDDDDVQWADLLEGQLHVAQLAPTRREEALALFGRASDGYTGPGVLDGVRSPVYLYGFDTSRAPFDDPRLRQAISLSIDRAGLAEEVAEGTRVPATSLVPPGIPGAQPGACRACAHSPLRARALLDEVVADLLGPTDDGRNGSEDGGDADDAEGDGGSDADEAAGETAGDEGDAGNAADDTATDEGDEGDTADDAAAEDGADTDDTSADDRGAEEVPPASEVIGVITLTYNRGTLHGAIAERMASDIAATLDLEVEFQGQDLAPFVQGVRSGEIPVFRHGWDVTEPSTSAYLYPLFHSSQIGMDNLTRFEDPEVDALLEQARATSAQEDRLEALQEAERRVLEAMPAIPVLWYRHDAVIRPEVRDLRYSALGRLSLSTAWLDPEWQEE